MKLDKKEKLIREGKHLLDEGSFPEKILLGIRDKRLQEQISRAIFRLPKGQRLDDLPSDEKKIRKLQLRVKRSFYEVFYGPIMIRRISAVMLVAGLLFLASSSLDLYTNLVYGITATVLSLILLGLTFSRDLLFSFLLPLGITTLLVVIIELVTLGLPDPLFSNLPNDGLLQRRRGGSIGMIFNQIVPFLFLTVKISTGGVVIYVNQKKDNYLKEKARLAKTTTRTK